MTITPLNPKEMSRRAGPRTTAPVTLGRKECWCTSCGESTNGTDPCPRCGSHHSIDPAKVLRPDEYRLV